MDWLTKLNWGEDQLDDLRLAGYAYIRQGKYEIALKFFEALCILATDDAYDPQTLGALYLQLNQPKKAVKAFDKALKLHADHAPTLLNLSKALFLIGRKEEAIKLCHILKREPNPVISSVAKALLMAHE